MFKIHALLRVTLFSSVMILGASSVAFSQTNSNDLRPWEGPQSDNQNSINNVLSGDASPGSLLDLINRIQQAGGKSPQEFSESQDKNWKSAITDFHEKQKERIEQTNVQPENP